MFTLCSILQLSLLKRGDGMQRFDQEKEDPPHMGTVSEATQSEWIRKVGLKALV